MPLFENNIIKDNVKDLRDKAESKFQKATSTSGSGSEVVRFGSYFGLGSDGRARLRTVASRAANHQGLGAEQEIHASHFGLDIEEVKNMLKRVEKRADKDIAAGRFWMGYDGHQRLMHIAGRKGVGAEQVSVIDTRCFEE
jgi:hypothetical protein